MEEERVCYIVGEGSLFDPPKELFVALSLDQVAQFLKIKFPKEVDAIGAAIAALEEKRSAYIEFPPKSPQFYTIKVIARLENSETVVDAEIARCVQFLSKSGIAKGVRKSFEAHLENMIKLREAAQQRLPSDSE